MPQGEKNAGLGAALLAALVGSKLEDRKQQGRVEAALRIAEQQQQEEAVISQAMNNLRGTPVSPALSPYPVSGMAYGGGVPVGMDGGMIRLASVADAAGRLMAKEAGFGNIFSAPATRRLLAAEAGMAKRTVVPSTHADLGAIMQSGPKAPALIPPKVPVGRGAPAQQVASPLAPLPTGRLQRAGELLQGAKQKAVGYLRPAAPPSPAPAPAPLAAAAKPAASPVTSAKSSPLGLKGQLALGGLAAGGVYLGGKALGAAGRVLGDGSGPADANYGTAGGYGGRQLSYGVNQYGYPQLGTPLM